MIKLEMPQFETDDEYEGFWMSGEVISTKYMPDMLEGIHKMLSHYGLGLGEYDAGMSEYVITVVKL